MQVKTSDLEGAALDWAVAAVTGEHDDGEHASMEIGLGRYSPSTDWSQGGPLIAEKITVLIDCEAGCYADTWANAGIYGQAFSEYDGQGPTLLVAAMRALVASEIGDEVEVPDELAADM